MLDLNKFTANQLGWSTFFNQQMSLEEMEICFPARVTNVYPNTVECLCEKGEISLSLENEMNQLVAGDWLLLTDDHLFHRVLDRSTELHSTTSQHTLVANLDTLFVVSSMNSGFDLSYIKDSVALAKNSHIEVVVILTHKDQCEDYYFYQDQVQAIRHDLVIEAINARDEEYIHSLLDWCGKGQMVALIGKENSGKSRIVKTLLSVTQTPDSSRFGKKESLPSNQFYLLSNAGLIFESAAIEELCHSQTREDKLHDALLDLKRLSKECRFADCKHTVEPGCAIQHAIKLGELDRSLISEIQSDDGDFDSDVMKRALDKKSDKLSKTLHSISRKNKKEIE
ncbi:GTPase RsgA [Marinomonas sp. 15G1-11]|uniref:GTPase RsgA n=1 Tax=Marinomonas phaeophyticola TaxID=3004091 RepID=A0ABT4JX04_9GAMM|nr:GTPase RsgA [Marinomonas sp. 15G1-11]MCZ2722919.1 GTPase RsgA [Marinomonas sp. 15G1-11]